MMFRHYGWSSLLSVALGLALCASAAGCGSDDNGGSDDDGGQGGTSATTSTSGSANGGAGAVGSGGGTTSAGGGGGNPPVEVNDPNLDGPYMTATVDDTVNVPATGNNVAIHAVYPTSGPSAGPYPVVVMGHGFQLPPTQYYSYVERLATHGYVAMTVDFQAGLLNVNNVNQAHELAAGLDWAEASSEVSSIADTQQAGASGHSLGGKVAVLAATMDARFKATITLDPVDGSMNCSPQDCPDVSELLPISIPTGFLGETIDAMGGFQACAPAADNFETFYANTSAPSLKVHVLGANHMSFLDDVANCGFPCTFCNMATADNATINELSRAFVVAFYERHLRGNTGYDTYLTGNEAQTRYVDTGLVTIESK